MFPSLDRAESLDGRELTVENSAITKRPFSDISRRMNRKVIIIVGIFSQIYYTSNFPNNH